VTVDVVTALVAAQFPAWRHLPITGIASSGTVNALFRIGDQLTAGCPLQPDDFAATLRWLEAEAAAADELLGRTRFPLTRM
jgi:hypothetical protein